MQCGINFPVFNKYTETLICLCLTLARTKLAVLYSATKSLQNSCTAKLQLFSSILEAKQQQVAAGCKSAGQPWLCIKVGRRQGDIGMRVWGLGDARQRTCRGQQVWDAGTCGTGTRGVKYKDVGTSNTGTWGMWMIIGKVRVKCNISFFVKMC